MMGGWRKFDWLIDCLFRKVYIYSAIQWLSEGVSCTIYNPWRSPEVWWPVQGRSPYQKNFKWYILSGPFTPFIHKHTVHTHITHRSFTPCIQTHTFTPFIHTHCTHTYYTPFIHTMHSHTHAHHSFTHLTYIVEGGRHQPCLSKKS